MVQQTGWPITQINAELPMAPSLAISVGDLLYWDSGASQVKPFSSRADAGSAAKQQADLARLFVGVSMQQALAADATQRNIRALIDGIYLFNCDSSTFAVGDFVGPSYNVNVARNQQVAKVSFGHLAIGRVVKRYSSATTVVKCRLMSRFLLGLPDRFNDVGACGQGVGVTTLADGAVTLTVDSNPILNMVPTAARNVTLPPESLSAGLKFYFTNNSAGADTVTFLASGGGGIKGNGAVPQNKTGIFWCDGTNWNGAVSA